MESMTGKVRIVEGAAVVFVHSKVSLIGPFRSLWTQPGAYADKSWLRRLVVANVAGAIVAVGNPEPG